MCMLRVEKFYISHILVKTIQDDIFEKVGTKVSISA